MAQNAALRIVCQAPRRQHHSVDLYEGSPLVTGAWQSRLQDCRPLLHSRQTTTTFVTYLSTLVIQTVACSDVIYVRPTVTVSTFFVDKHCCSSVLMPRPLPFGTVFPYFVHTADSFTSFRSQLKTCSNARKTFAVGPPSIPNQVFHAIQIVTPHLGFTYLTTSLHTMPTACGAKGYFYASHSEEGSTLFCKLVQ